MDGASSSWSRETTANKNRWLLGFAFDAFGKRPVELIDSRRRAGAAKPLKIPAGNETARRVKVKCGQVFRYAIATRRLKHDPTTALARALKPVVVKPRRHHRPEGRGRAAA